MTIRGDIQAIIASSEGDLDKAADGILDWLTCADVIMYLDKDVGCYAINGYSACVDALRDKCSPINEDEMG